MNLILIAVISLGAIALVLAAVLYVASKKFAVYEDPRIAQVSEVLPQANCGDVVIRVAADLPMLASKPVRWKVSFVRWVDSL